MRACSTKLARDDRIAWIFICTTHKLQGFKLQQTFRMFRARARAYNRLIGAALIYEYEHGVLVVFGGVGESKHAKTFAAPDK